MGSSGTSLEGRIEAWMGVWNAPDPAERRRLARLAWSDQGRYTDPWVDVVGVDNIADAVGALIANFPGHQVRRSSGIERHFDQLRFTWELVAPDGAVVSDGVDFAAVDADQRLVTLCGFAGAQVPVPLETQ